MTKKIIFVVFISLVLLGFIYISFTNKVFPNIYVSGVYVGDKTKSKAVELLKAEFKLPEKIILETNGKKDEIKTSEIITGINYESSIERVINLTSSGNFVRDIITKINLIFKPVNLLLTLTVDQGKLLETILIVTEKSGTKPIPPSVKKENNQIKVNRGKNGIEVDSNKIRHDIVYTLSQGKGNVIQINLQEIKTELSDIQAEEFKTKAEKLLGKNIQLKFENQIINITDSMLLSFLTPDGFSDELIKKKILEISRELNRGPQDSVFIIEDGKVQEFTPSKDGITVDEDQLLKLIKDVPETIDIPVIKVSPKITNKEVNDLGIDTLIGYGNSTFKGSIANRIYNVNLAQSKFRGLLVPPGEIVSFNEMLGDVSYLTGYKAAYVIKDGKTVLGDGGGVCQVSTTLFRAVLNAGLPVIERKAHAYRVGYYEQGSPPGLDATVYSPTTDFKFKNDTPAYLLIQPTIDLNKLTLKFEIYGTSDGRISTISKPVITSSIAPAADLYIDDPTLPAGTIRQIEHKAYGARVVFDYKVARNGEELINKTFVSNYRPWQAVYLKGTSN